MILPNFIILGASKAGTSSLYSYLGQHPEIFMSPKKETNYFAVKNVKLELSGPGDKEWYDGAIKDLPSYKAQFEEVENEKAIGEASPTYLHSKIAPKNIYETIPDAKLIAILRNPVDRAYSHYTFFKGLGLEPFDTFEEALQFEDDRLNKGWFWPRYKYAGLYAQQLKRYYQYFEEEQVKIIKFDDFVTNTKQVIKEIFDYLGVEEEVDINLSVQHNASGIPRNKRLNSLFSPPKKVRETLKPIIPQFLKDKILQVKNDNLVKPPMKESTRKRLREYFRDEIEELERVTGRKFEEWLN